MKIHPCYHKKESFTFQELSEIGHAQLVSSIDPETKLYGIAPIEDATALDVSFVANKAFLSHLQTTKAGLCIVDPLSAQKAPESLSLLITDDPHTTYAQIACAFYPLKKKECDNHSHTLISPLAKIGKNCKIGSFVTIEDYAEIGDNTQILNYTQIGEYVKIGKNGYIGHHVTIGCAHIGDHVTIHAGARIGEPGFGFAISPQGHFTTIPQVGYVEIGNHVEIGANTAIDRGSNKNTIIGDNCHIDNLVQIGHNARLGKGCVLAGQVGIAGSVEMEDYVMLGGQVGVTPHVKIGAFTKAMAQTGIIQNTGKKETLFGTPAQDSKAAYRQLFSLKKLTKNKKP